MVKIVFIICFVVFIIWGLRIDPTKRKPHICCPEPVERK